MRETVSRNHSIECVSVSPASSWQLLRWIHFELADSDFAGLLADLQPRLAANPKMPPMEILIGQSRVAAAYFIRLEGNVATLGGLRALRGNEQLAGKMIQEFQTQLHANGITQIQALVDIDNLSAKLVMLNSPFRQATTVSHLWRDLTDHCVQGNNLASNYSMQPTYQFSRDQVDALVESTFRGTLDCPDLDGMRSASEVVGGFLESKAWDANLPWWILCNGRTLVGCSLVNPHPKEIFELVYIGLIESERGRGLGRALVQCAIDESRLRGGRALTTAVDTRNWPAREIYRTLGFSEIRELGVWLPKEITSQPIATA